MEIKTHWKKLTNPDYLGAYDFQPNEERIVKILSVAREVITGPDGKKEECTVAKLANSKPMILNKTNCKTISKAYGTPYIEDWVNISIKIYVAKVKAFGDVVDALRVQCEKVEVKKPVLSPASSKWDAAVKSLKDKNTTVDAILKVYEVSELDLITLENATV